jgi:hypothetical protein
MSSRNGNNRGYIDKQGIMRKLRYEQEQEAMQREQEAAIAMQREQEAEMQRKQEAMQREQEAEMQRKKAIQEANNNMQTFNIGESDELSRRARDMMNDRVRNPLRIFDVPPPDAPVAAAAAPPPPPPPAAVMPALNNPTYSYRVTSQARNFPEGHNYLKQAVRPPPIILSREAQDYENRETLAAMRTTEGGRKKKSRQKKQHRRHRRRHSTRKYKK